MRLQGEGLQKGDDMDEKRPSVGVRVVPTDNLITGAEFLDVANNLLRLAAEVDIALSGQFTRTVDWALRRMSYASPALFELEPLLREGQPDNRVAIVDAIISGIQNLQTVADRPRYFSDQALKSAVGLVAVLGERVDRVQIFSNGSVVDCTEAISTHTRTILRPGREMLGSIDGVLQALNSHGYFQFALFEPVFGRRIEGRLDDNAPASLKSEIVELFDRRVRLSGVLRTNVRGETISVRAQSIIILRSTVKLQSAETLAGIFDITGGLSAEDYIRSLRDA